MSALEEATGQTYCCNKPYSGTDVIDDYGKHHLATGELILYTSADSVLQIAAHVDVLDEPGLYEVCEKARDVMDGEHRVGRVIARPFEGEPGDFRRREGRRDYAAPPPGRTYLEEIQDAGLRGARGGQDPRPVRRRGNRREARRRDQCQGDRGHHLAARVARRG